LLAIYNLTKVQNIIIYRDTDSKIDNIEIKQIGEEQN